MRDQPDCADEHRREPDEQRDTDTVAGASCRPCPRSRASTGSGSDTAACANALSLRAYRERPKAARFSDLSERDPG